jgi:hypothetical protein
MKGYEEFKKKIRVKLENKQSKPVVLKRLLEIAKRQVG